MVNAVYDLPLAGLNLPFQPYVGGGIGYSRVDLSDVTSTDPFLFPVIGGGTFPGTGVRTNGSANAFAYQAIAGASLPVTFVPGLDLTLEYRYFATTTTTIATTTRSPTRIPFINVPSTVYNVTKVGARDNAVMLGLRYAFGAPRI